MNPAKVNTKKEVNNNSKFKVLNGLSTNKTLKLNNTKAQADEDLPQCNNNKANSSSDLNKSTVGLKLTNTPLTQQNVNEKQGSESTHKHRKRKAPNKKDVGTSNWMNLCQTLNIAKPNRKKVAEKRPAEEDTPSTDSKKSKPVIWFDNVDNILLESETSEVEEKTKKSKIDPLVKPDSFKGFTNCVAMDCEMVGVGPDGIESILARVSIVNHFGVCLYDKFVLPREEVTDYRTFVSGVTAENLSTGEEFTKVQQEVSDIIRGRVLVGHAIHNDLRALFLTHPQGMIRDTSLYKPFRELFNGRLPSLKKLTAKVLGVSVQEGQHSSIQDAQATMRLYTMHRQKWEKEFQHKQRLKKKKNKKEKKK